MSSQLSWVGGEGKGESLVLLFVVVLDVVVAAMVVMGMLAVVCLLKEKR